MFTDLYPFVKIVGWFEQIFEALFNVSEVENTQKCFMHWSGKNLFVNLSIFWIDLQNIKRAYEQTNSQRVKLVYVYMFESELLRTFTSKKDKCTFFQLLTGAPSAA